MGDHYEAYVTFDVDATLALHHLEQSQPGQKPWQMEEFDGFDLPGDGPLHDVAHAWENLSFSTAEITARNGDVVTIRASIEQATEGIQEFEVEDLHTHLQAAGVAFRMWHIGDGYQAGRMLFGRPDLDTIQERAYCAEGIYLTVSELLAIAESASDYVGLWTGLLDHFNLPPDTQLTNAGCERCGTHDRAEFSDFCTDCLAEIRT